MSTQFAPLAHIEAARVAMDRWDPEGMVEFVDVGLAALPEVGTQFAQMIFALARKTERELPVREPGAPQSLTVGLLDAAAAVAVSVARALEQVRPGAEREMAARLETARNPRPGEQKWNSR